MFWILTFGILAQLFFMAKGIENIPFFLYHMYSKPHYALDSSAVLLIKTPTGYFNHKALSNREQEVLMNSVSNYVNLKIYGDGTAESVNKRFVKSLETDQYQILMNRLTNNKIALDSFPAWWGRYYDQFSRKKTDSVSVVKSYVYNNKTHAKSNYDSLIFTIKLK